MNKKNKKILIAVIITCGFVIGGYITLRSVYYAPNDEIVISPTLEKAITQRKEILEEKSEAFVPAFTKRLTIPSLKIDAKIQDVGITRKGNISTPNNFFDVGLYKYGVFPGDMGSAIIDGHVDNGFGFKAVFGNLSDIQIGADIYVETKEGVDVHFIVTGTAIYDYTDSAEKILSEKDNSYLKLITCTGKWIPEYRTHDKRLVVTAVKTSQ